MEYKTKKQVAIIAVGNGGYNLATQVIESGIFANPQLVIVDTDKNDIESKKGVISTVGTKFVLVERPRVDEAECDVSGTIPADAETVVVCSTLGAKTGSLYAPMIAMDAQLKGKKVYSLSSLPFMAEGASQVARALKAAEKLEFASNIFMIQNNDKLKDLNDIMMFDMDRTMIKLFKEIMDGLDFPMRTRVLLKDRFDPITISFPELSIEERLEKFKNA